MAREFTLPDLGEGISEAQIIKVLISEGEDVSEDQSLMEVETDKAAVEIPSPFAGPVQKLHVSEGQTVNVGDVIVTFADNGAAPKAEAPKKEKKSEKDADAPKASSDGSEEQPKAQASPPASGGKKTTAAAAPAVRKLARERGLDLDSIPGSGPGGRITKDDVLKFAEGGGAASATGDAKPAGGGQAGSAMPTSKPRQQASGPRPGTPGTDKWGPIRTEPISQIRKTIAKQMSQSAYTAVHVTHGDDADITELDRMRHELNDVTENNPKLTVMTFVIRATCIALKNHPEFNSSFDLEGNQITYKDYVNMGIAVDTERGLIVPVIRNADQLTMRGIAQELRSIADRIRSNQFAIDDLRGGTFTITNVGALGGKFSTPIINYPEVAILGLGRSQKVPAYRGDQVVPRLMLPVNLSFDHRATDGANAARFTSDIIRMLEHPGLMLLD